MVVVLCTRRCWWSAPQTTWSSQMVISLPIIRRYIVMIAVLRRSLCARRNGGGRNAAVGRLPVAAPQSGAAEGYHLVVRIRTTLSLFAGSCQRLSDRRGWWLLFER